MDLKELLEFTYHEGFREGKEMGKQFPMNDPLPFKRWWKNDKVKDKVKAFGNPVKSKIKSLHKHDVSQQSELLAFIKFYETLSLQEKSYAQEDIVGIYLKANCG